MKTAKQKNLSEARVHDELMTRLAWLHCLPHDAWEQRSGTQGLLMKAGACMQHENIFMYIAVGSWSIRSLVAT